jgi:hypothetical protein
LYRARTRAFGHSKFLLSIGCGCVRGV